MPRYLLSQESMGTYFIKYWASVRGLYAPCFFSFHGLFLGAWLTDGDSLMYCIVMMGRQIAEMFYTFSLRGSLFLMRIFSCPGGGHIYAVLRARPPRGSRWTLITQGSVLRLLACSVNSGHP